MTPLERAIGLLRSSDYTCILCDRDRVLTSKKTGIAPLLERCEDASELAGMEVADRIVGKAAAMLLTLFGVKAVYGEVMSKTALQFLTAHGIEAQYGTLVPMIINRKGDGMCPMEQTVAALDDPAAVPDALRATLKRLKAGK